MNIHQSAPATGPPAPTAVERHLRDILDSGAFSGSERRRNLLEFIVEESLAGRSAELKAYVLATRVLHRPEGFDPQVDPIVRVEVGRLRATLDRFYREHPEATIEISIPKGQYGADFAHRAGTGASLSEASESIPRVVVLPFSGTTEPGLEHLADGMTEELGRRLGRASMVAVVTGLPRDLFEESTIDPGAACDEFGARFAVRGRVRAQQGRVRVNADLFDASEGGVVWSDDFEANYADLHPFEVEDWIVDRISGRLADEYGVIGALLSRSGEARSAGGSSLADTMWRYHRATLSPTAANMNEATRGLEAATALEGDHPRLLAALSDLVFTTWWLGFDDSQGGLERAHDLAERAVALDPAYGDAHLALAYCHFGQRRPRLLRLEIERALELDPWSPRMRCASGLMLALDGALDEGQELIDRAVEFNPHLPAWRRIPAAVGALVADDPQSCLVEAVQVGDAGAFIGPLLRLAARGQLGLDASADAKALQEIHADFSGRTDLYLERFFHDPAVIDVVRDGIEASGELTHP